MMGSNVKNAKNSLSTGMLVVLVANILNLSLSLIRSFLLPKYLSIPAYADIKTYQLYLSYSSLLTFGYIDGMYLRYGGVDLQTTNQQELSENLSTFRYFMLGISVIISATGLIVKNAILVAMGMSIIAFKSIDYFQSLFQAIGRFSTYSAVMNIMSVLMFFANIVLLFVLNEVEAKYYIVSYVLVYYVVWIFLEFKIHKILKRNLFQHFSIHELRTSITDGFTLMLGTLLAVFLMEMDRWCVKLAMDTYSFATYSFAVSSVGFLSYAISPISVTLYSYFCRQEQSAKYPIIRGEIILFNGLLISMAFPVLFILENYLVKYSTAKNVVFILFASQMITGIILCFYVNLYKAHKMQRKYFSRIVLVVTVGLLLNILLYILLNTYEAFAFGTLFTSIIWMITCCIDHKEVCLSGKERVFILLLCVLFLGCGFCLKSYHGFIVYLLGYMLLSSTLLRKQFTIAINQVKDIFRHVIARLCN